MTSPQPSPAAVPADLGVLTFPRGIPGFPDCQRFVLSEFVDDGAFQLLQSIDDPEVSMVVSVPWLFFPDYAPELTPGDSRELGLTSPEDAVVFCPVSVAPESEELFLNLLGPFIVNSRTREGRQVVLEADHPVRARIPVSG